MHARQQIREAVGTLLDGLTTTGSNVYQSRVYPHDTLPCLSIYTLTENVEDTTQDGKQHRQIILNIEGRAKATDNLDDTLDTIAEEVESALLADPFLSALSSPLKLMELTSTEIELSDDLNKPSGVIRLLFIAHYRVNETDPSTLID